MAPHSSTFAWKIPWMEKPGGLQSMGLLESDMTERLHFHFSLSCIGEGNGNPLQCSCLENPRDGGAWWAAISWVAQSRTRLKRLSSSSSLLWNLLTLGWSWFQCRNVSFWVSSCLLIFHRIRRSLMFSRFGVKPSPSGFQSYSYSSLKTSPSI